MDVLLKALCDPENQPHQWMGDSVELGQVIRRSMESETATPDFYQALVAIEKRVRRSEADRDALMEIVRATHLKHGMTAREYASAYLKISGD